VLGELIDIRQGPRLTMILGYAGQHVEDPTSRSALETYLKGLSYYFAPPHQDTIDGVAKAFADRNLDRIFGDRGVFFTTGHSRLVAETLARIAEARQRDGKDTVVGVVVSEVGPGRMLADVRREARAMRAELLRYPFLAGRVFTTTPPRLSRTYTTFDDAIVVLGASAITTDAQVIHQRARLEIVKELRERAKKGTMPVVAVCEPYKVISSMPYRDLLTRSLVAFDATGLDLVIVGGGYWRGSASNIQRGIARERETWEERVRRAVAHDIFAVLQQFDAPRPSAIHFRPTMRVPWAESDPDREVAREEG
jgi:hypothetical protein